MPDRLTIELLDHGDHDVRFVLRSTLNGKRQLVVRRQFSSLDRALDVLASFCHAEQDIFFMNQSVKGLA